MQTRANDTFITGSAKGRFLDRRKLNPVPRQGRHGGRHGLPDGHRQAPGSERRYRDRHAPTSGVRRVVRVLGRLGPVSGERNAAARRPGFRKEDLRARRNSPNAAALGAPGRWSSPTASPTSYCGHVTYLAQARRSARASSLRPNSDGSSNAPGKRRRAAGQTRWKTAWRSLAAHESTSPSHGSRRHARAGYSNGNWHVLVIRRTGAPKTSSAHTRRRAGAARCT